MKRLWTPAQLHHLRAESSAGSWQVRIDLFDWCIAATQKADYQHLQSYICWHHTLGVQRCGQACSASPDSLRCSQHQGQPSSRAISSLTGCCMPWLESRQLQGQCQGPVECMKPDVLIATRLQMCRLGQWCQSGSSGGHSLQGHLGWLPLSVLPCQGGCIHWPLCQLGHADVSSSSLAGCFSGVEAASNFT